MTDISMQDSYLLSTQERWSDHMECNKARWHRCEKSQKPILLSIHRSDTGTRDQEAKRTRWDCRYYTERMCLLIALELTQIVSGIQNSYSNSSAQHSFTHHQLTGNIALRSTKNAMQIKAGILLLHCEGNPFIVKPVLKNMLSSRLVPEGVKDDILKRDTK